MTTLLQQALERGAATPKTAAGRTAVAAPAPAHDEPKSYKTEVKDAILTGISHIILVIIAGGMTLAVAPGRLAPLKMEARSCSQPRASAFMYRWLTA